MQLTGLGKRYLERETDMRYHRRPRWVEQIDAEILKNNLFILFILDIAQKNQI